MPHENSVVLSDGQGDRTPQDIEARLQAGVDAFEFLTDCYRRAGLAATAARWRGECPRKAAADSFACDSRAALTHHDLSYMRGMVLMALATARVLAAMRRAA